MERMWTYGPIYTWRLKIKKTWVRTGKTDEGSEKQKVT